MSPAERPPRLPRRWLSFSLRALLVLMVLLSLPLAWIAHWRASKLYEHEVRQRLEELGGSTTVRLEHQEIQYAWDKSQSWLRHLLPENCRQPVLAYSSEVLEHHPDYNGQVGNSPINAEVIGLVADLPNLRVLELIGTREPDVALKRLRNLPSLRNLTIACDADDDDVACFLNQRELRWLVLNDQPITDRSLQLVRQNQELDFLALNITKVSDEGLRQLSNLSNLTWLSLHETKITSAGIAHLETLPKLQFLAIGKTQVDDTAIASLTKLKTLAGLHLGRSQITPEGIERIQTALPKCIVFKKG